MGTYPQLQSACRVLPCPALASVDDCKSLTPAALCKLCTRFPPSPLPGMGRTHKPCAAAQNRKHNERQRLKMCSFHQQPSYLPTTKAVPTGGGLLLSSFSSPSIQQTKKPPFIRWLQKHSPIQLHKKRQRHSIHRPDKIPAEHQFFALLCS